MADNAKQNRTTAKRLFTRSNNQLKLAIQNKDYPAVEEYFQSLKARLKIVQDEHEKYITMTEATGSVLDESTEDAWMQDIEEEFECSAKMSRFMINDAKSTKQEVSVDDISHSFDAITVKSTRQQEIEKANNMRIQEKTNFMEEANSMRDILDTDEADDTWIIELQKDLKQQLGRCKDSQATYISLLDLSIASAEFSWLKEIQRIYTDISMKASRYVKKCKQIEEEQCRKPKQGIKLERMKRPTFNNNIRDYPRFKKDFERQVAPEYSSPETAAFVLKSCLCDGALDVVKNVDDDIDEMWRRLDKKFGSPSRMIDAIMSDINNIGIIGNHDDVSFIKFVDTIEQGYRDLSRLNLQNEISTTTVISMIERKLPRDIRRLWARRIEDDESQVDVTNKFPEFLKFMLAEKRAVEYDNAQVRIPSCNNPEGSSNHIQDVRGRGSADQGKRWWKCYLHKSENEDNHSTAD